LGDTYEGTLKNNYLYNDKELFDDADLNWYDYGFRNYDPQIGRFPQLDPLTYSYPFLTPYQYASCDPIDNIDIDGLEGGLSTTADKAITLSEVIVKSAPVYKEMANVVVRSLPRAASAGAKSGIGVGKIIGTVFKVNNLINVIVTKPVSCHGAYQNGFTVFNPGKELNPGNGVHSGNGIQMWGANTWDMGPARKSDDPDGQAEDIMLIVFGSLNMAPSMSDLNLIESKSKIVRYLAGLKDLTTTFEGGLETNEEYQKQENKSSQNAQNEQTNTPIRQPKYDSGDPLMYPGPPGKGGYIDSWYGGEKGKSMSDNLWKQYRQKHPHSRYVEPAPMRSSQIQKKKTSTYAKKR
jgi:RHS repeat-associated protein